ncbi:MAG: hypothetical protein WC776_04900 [Patescibacteria group bacterium]|jgi:hypothetical protein
MLEENKGEFFEDLPDEGGEQPAAAPAEGEQETAEQKLLREQKIKELTIANKKEDARLEKLQADLAEKRKQRKILIKKDEEGEEEEEEKPAEEKPLDVKAEVASALREQAAEERRQNLREKIRKVAKTRQEAERIYAEALQLPPSGSDELDVKFAVQRYQALKEHSRGFASPSFSGGASASDLESHQSEGGVEGFSPERLAYLEKLGITKEDLKKRVALEQGMDLGKVWPSSRIFKN